MVETKIKYATSASITLTLPGDGAARESTAIDNSTNLYDDALVHVKFSTGTVTGNKMAYIWVYASEDGTNYDSVATGSDAAITLRSPESLQLAYAIPVPTSSVAYQVTFSTARLFGGVLPRKWGIIFQADGTGTSTSGSFTYTGITYTSA